MTAGFYPPYLRQRFTNRVRELNFLQRVADDLAAVSISAPNGPPIVG